MMCARQALFGGIIAALLTTGLDAQQAAAPSAPAPLQVTLAEAIRRALEVQPTVVQALGTQRTTGANERSAVGAFLPSISVGGSSNNGSSIRFNQSTGSPQIVSSTTSYTGSVSLSLSLFDGFARLANKQAAGASHDAADAGVVNQRYQVTATTAQLFFTALADEELVRVAQAQIDRAKEERQISVNKFQAGAATRSDTLTSTVDLGNAQLALLQAQGNLATAQANLGRQVGVQQPVRALPDSAFPPLPDTTTLRAAVVDGSPQVLQADAEARAARSQVTVARAQYWPTLSASYSNGYSGATAPWSTTQGYLNNWSLRFAVTWTLFDGFSREASQVSASVQRDVAEANAADMRRQVHAQLTQQLATVLTAYAQIGIAGSNVTAATEALRVQQERYRLGAATLLDLLTSEANKTQADVSEVQARYNYLIARAQLEALVGHSL